MADNYMDGHRISASSSLNADDVLHNRIHSPDDKPGMASSDSLVAWQEIWLVEHSLVQAGTMLIVPDPFLAILRIHIQVIQPIANLLP